MHCRRCSVRPLLTVTNVAPTNLVATAVGTVTSTGNAASISATFDDPGTLDDHEVLIDWGDGSAPDTITLPAGVTSFLSSDYIAPHVYPHALPSTPSYHISVTVTDTISATLNESITTTVTFDPFATTTTTLSQLPVTFTNYGDALTVIATVTANLPFTGGGQCRLGGVRRQLHGGRHKSGHGQRRRRHCQLRRLDV